MADHLRELALQLAEAFHHLAVTGKLDQGTRADTRMTQQLSLNQIKALEILYSFAGLSQKELAEKLHITSASVSIALKVMEHDGFIERQQNAADKRVTNLYLTEKGRAAVEEMIEVRLQSSINFLQLLSPEEQAQVVHLFQQAAAHSREDNGLAAKELKKF